MEDPVVTRNDALHRYEVHAGGRLAGYAEYNALVDAVMFTHTEVDPAFEGQGHGSTLARAALEDVRTQGKHVIPLCPFIAAFIRRHPEYLDLVKPDSRAAFKL